ncbi:MAG: trigger factor [Ghiorsea sp.]|nr:trigger factor [Ghiorsea sp.]MDQ7005250.1 trigger factor [Ghiorsea sp.]
MIQTEVKKLGDNEHEVEVRLPKSEYDRVYTEEKSKLISQVKLPGFRPGKTPGHVIETQFGPKIHEDTVSQLLQQHYVAAIESSKLIPAIQPELSLPKVQPDDAFLFTLKVSSWPEVTLTDVGELSFDEIEVTVDDEDIAAVLERLYKSQVSYEIKEERAAEKGDQLHLDFEGFIGDEAFDGGKGEDVALVLGEGRFIPGFEEQLIGKKAGETCTVEISFPEDYQAPNLAGKAARFETTVKSVGEATKAQDDESLAKLLNFDDANALMEDIRQGLEKEATQASKGATRESALDALIEAHELTFPEGLIVEDMKATASRVVQNMKQQGMDATEDMLNDEAFKAEVRVRSIRGLNLSAVLQAVRKDFDILLTAEEIDAGVDEVVTAYPEHMRDDYAKYIRDNEEQMAALKDRMLEQKCIDHVVSKGKVTKVTQTLAAWQKEQDKVIS